MILNEFKKKPQTSSYGKIVVYKRDTNLYATDESQYSKDFKVFFLHHDKIKFFEKPLFAMKMTLIQF